jgi:leucyl-tRNA synthetase
MDYNFREIEARWRKEWCDKQTYKVDIDPSRPKYYVLDMFPYPSGAGLHVGHPLGYIASDIFSRYKRLKGFNVLHPMGYDAFGLPAEQYAIQTGQHPAITTENNIRRYREQLDKIGFSFDWSREVRTSDPEYYHWTQWAFIRMFNHWYNKAIEKAEPIEKLIAEFEKNGNTQVNASCSETSTFSAAEWKAMDKKQQEDILLNYRIAYLADALVNWCPKLGTVLANDEVKDGISVRGGHPVEQRKMRQWQLRISAYAQRLLDGLDNIEWTDSLKDIQRNWIGRSQGAEIEFHVAEKVNENTPDTFTIFTTRPDTLWGVTFMVLAPESELLAGLTSKEQQAEVAQYVEMVKNRNERERMADTRKTGVFTGSYAVNPFNGDKIPIWVSDYVLAGYGTGAIMAVPGHDQRDFDFARAFNLNIIQVVVPSGEEPSDPSTWTESKDAKEGRMINSGFVTGLSVVDSIKKVIDYVEEKKLGSRRINFRLRDAIFGRQRYWGEPIPAFYNDGLPNMLPDDQLPLVLPEVDAYLPTEKGEPPLGRAKNWKTADGHAFEMSTMPGFAGSSAYYIRYTDPHNTTALVSPDAMKYWGNVDLYIGGTEHATGHLIYSRFWCKFLFDLGVINFEEPFQKLINQGMIQGRSNFVYRIKNSNTFVSFTQKDKYEVTEIHVDVNMVENDILDTERFRNWNPEYKTAEFILDEDGKYRCGSAVEKMSKSMFNVVNPDDIIERYGADTLRLYEMFLGPIEQSKPWDTKGIDGVSRFLRKLWRLFHDKDDNFVVSNEPGSPDEMKVLHRTIKRITDDIERFSFNTSVSNFMICVNDLSDLKCNKREVLQPLVVLLSPFAPHIAEELWHLLGNNGTVCDAQFPVSDEKYLVENSFEYPVSFNGKMRYKLTLPLNLSVKEIEEAVMANEASPKYLEGKTPKKFIIIPGKIINVVI